MRVIIHIGTLKTGSTCLQHFFFKNRGLLFEENIFFPTKGLAKINYSRGGRFSGHNEFLLAVKRKENSFTDQFIRDLEQADTQFAVLSSENFSIHPDAAQPLADLLKKFTVQVVVYLRRQDNYLESLYKEFINGGWHKITEDVQTFFYNNVGQYCTIERDYYQLLTPWAEAFGLENIFVRPFEVQQLHEQDLIKDFFHTTGLPWNNNYMYPEESAKNVSHDIQINKILLDLNRLPLQQTYYQEALNLIFNEHLKTISSGAKKQFFSSPYLRYHIIQKYAEGNKQVARTYLARENGKLFYDSEPDPDEAFTPFRTKDIDLVSKLYSIFLMQFGKELNDQLSNTREEIDQQKSELDKIIGEADRQEGKLDKHEEELDKHEEELDKHEERVKLLEQLLNKTKKAQKQTKKDIKSLRKEILAAHRLSRKNSLVIWVNARKKISRRIKNFLRPEIPLIKKSGLFDSQWYLRQYPEVAKSGMDPIDHYVKKGVMSGYNPSSDFDTYLYIQNNMTVMMSGLNPLVSYILKNK